ncbi:phage tail protein, partial [Escherichia coli]|uniref:phage tail protein n=1 Tax=Escherichia coli TaxID=562 RepID=UPI001F4A2AD1
MRSKNTSGINVRAPVPPHQTMQRESDYHWPSNSRIGKRDAFQFLGVGEENITLAGVLYPEL